MRELDWWELKQGEITFPQHYQKGLFDRNKTLWGAWHFKNYYHSFIHLGDVGYSDDFKEIRKRLGQLI